MESFLDIIFLRHDKEKNHYMESRQAKTMQNEPLFVHFGDFEKKIEIKLHFRVYDINPSHTRIRNVCFLQNIPINPKDPDTIVRGKRQTELRTSPFIVSPSLRFPTQSLLRILIQLSSMTPVWSFQTRPITKYPIDTH